LPGKRANDGISTEAFTDIVPTKKEGYRAGAGRGLGDKVANDIG
jgi:hypothetical protein